MTNVPRNNVFISYSHKDIKWMKKLKTIFKPLIDQNKILWWDDSNIEPGKKWYNEIANALKIAGIALLLVSDNFLASDFIVNEELPPLLDAAQKGDCRIFWILIDECLYEEYRIHEFQAAHDIKQPLSHLPAPKTKTVLTNIARQIAGLCKDAKTQASKPSPQNQIKVLSITAAPGDDLQYEKEQDTLLEVFQGFNREQVYLEIPDPVDSTLTEIEQRLRDGKHDILHLTAHGQINEHGEGFLALENAEGKEIPVTGTELMTVLNAVGHKPKIVILTSCHSARPEAQLVPVAETLFKAGIHSVIGMKRAVKYKAAIRFNQAFFQQLCERETVKIAFEAGRTAILEWEQRMQRDNPQWRFLNESEVPALLTQDENMTAADFAPHRIEAPEAPRSHQFEGARHLDRGFIGRRNILRRIYRQVEPEGAVVLKGPGGIGKSTLTTRAAAKLSGKGYQFIVVRGQTSEADILEKISQKAVAAGVVDAEKVFAAQGDEIQKLAWFLGNYLLARPVVVIFDNFEDNQTLSSTTNQKFCGGPGGSFSKKPPGRRRQEISNEEVDFVSEGLKRFMWFFRDSLRAKPSVLLISTRYGLSGFEAETVEVTELSANEAAKLMLNGRALKELKPESKQGLLAGVGGNPRVLELLDGIAFREFGEGVFDWEGLKGLFPEMKRRMFEKRGKGDDFTPLMLDMLWSYLTPGQRELLAAVSVYRVPVVFAAVEAQGVGENREDRLRLEDLSLLSYLKPVGESPAYYYVHRLTAGYVLERMPAEEQRQAHARAAEYFWSIRTEENSVDLSDGIEARHHFLRAEEWDKAAAVTFSLIAYLTLHGFPRRSLELLKELPLERLSDGNRTAVIGEMGSLYMHFGDHDKAVSCHQQAYQIAEAANDSRKAAVALHQLGILHRHQGRYEAAGEFYRKSMEIKEKLGNIKGVATTLHQLGMLHQQQGRYEEAGENYRECLDRFTELGAIQEQATTLHELGNLFYLQGRYEEAGKNYRECLDRFTELGALKEQAAVLGQLGNLHYLQGRYAEAGENYNECLDRFIDLGALKEQATTLHQLGMLHQDQGRYEEAGENYRKAMEIMEKIGDISGMATTTAQMGKFFFEQEQFADALDHFARAYLIFRRLQSPNAQKALEDIAITREKLPPEEFEKIMKENGLELREPE